MQVQTYQFHEFVAKFPAVTLPVTLGEETHHTFGLENEPLPEGMIEQFIHPTQSEVKDDEFTEYLPCFAIDNTESFLALVWWRASLLQYEYILATYTAKGELISQAVIAETKVVDGKVFRSVATINEEWEIYIAEGVSLDGNVLFDPGSSRTYEKELLANGEII